MRPGQIVAVLIVIVIAVVLAVAVLSGVPGSEPSPTAGPTALASAEPSSTPEPTPAIGCEVAHEPGTLALRIEARGELAQTWVITIYDDGRVFTPGITPNEPSDEAWRVVRFLTDAGLDRLVGEVVDTGLFEVSAQYSPVPLPGVEPPGRGASGYTITVAQGSEQVVVSWVSVFADDATYYEPSPEREQLDALAADLIEFDSWLPAEEWAMAEPCPYRAQAFGIYVEAQAWGGSLDELPVDIADVAWPLGGDIFDWGEEIDHPDPDPAHLARCAVASRADAETLGDDLRSAGAGVFVDGGGLDVGAYTELRLGDRASTRVVSVYIQPLMPEESECPDFLPNPFGI
jgi:hypothetical protein